MAGPLQVFYSCSYDVTGFLQVFTGYLQVFYGSGPESITGFLQVIYRFLQVIYRFFQVRRCLVALVEVGMSQHPARMILAFWTPSPLPHESLLLGPGRPVA